MSRAMLLLAVLGCSSPVPESLGRSGEELRVIDHEPDPACFAGRADYRALCAAARNVDGAPVGDRYAFDGVCLELGGAPFLSTGRRPRYIDGCAGIGVFAGVEIICCGGP